MINIRTRPVHILVSALCLAALTACGHDEPKAASPTLLDFCEPLLTFFKTDLKIDGVTMDREDANKPISDIVDSAKCNFNRGDRSFVSGSAGLARASDDQRTREDHLKETGYTSQPGYSAEIWIKDDRDWKRRPGGNVQLIAELGPWSGELEIIDDTEPLAITDEQVRAAGELLIDATRKMGQPAGK